jgi:hypothetical protein
MAENAPGANRVERPVPSIGSDLACTLWRCDMCPSLAKAPRDQSDGPKSFVQPVDGDVCGICGQTFVGGRSEQIVRDAQLAKELAINDKR